MGREAPQLHAKTARVLARASDPHNARSPATPTEAEFLRSIATPERLIGPPA